MHHTTHPLPLALRERGERFFGTSLAGIHLKVAPMPLGLNARAMASEDVIWVAPGCDDFSRPEHLALLGHELTHVLQQRQGRVTPTHTWQDQLMNGDAGLEREADEMGARFAAGLPCGIDFSSPVGPRSRGISQCSVVVGATVVQSLDHLSRKARQVISLIEDGIPWLRWAIREVRSTYNFAGEDQLTEGLQVGLHGTPLLLLPRLELLVNPLVLMAMDGADVAVLVEYEQSDHPTTTEQNSADDVLKRYKLLNQEGLQSGLNLISTLGVAGKGVFQAMDLGERIALAHLNTWYDQNLVQDQLGLEAAQYAISLAQSPVEFVDLFQFYSVLINRIDPESESSAAQHQQAVTKVLDQLKPQLRGQLQSATIGPPPNPDALLQFLQMWTSPTNKLGFPRFTTAANQVLQNTTLGSEKAPHPSELVHQYLEKARAFVDCKQSKIPVLSQDGLSYIYKYPHPKQSATVVWRDGNVMLTHFRDDAMVDPVEEQCPPGRKQKSEPPKDDMDQESDPQKNKPPKAKKLTPPSDLNDPPA